MLWLTGEQSLSKKAKTVHFFMLGHIVSCTTENKKNARFLGLFLLIFLGICAPIFVYQTKAQSGGAKLVNYHLGQLYSGMTNDLSKYDILVLSPAQIATHQGIMGDIKKLNPQIIILAYVPSQSYNTNYWPRDVVFSALNVSDAWWLRDSRGKIISAWPGIKNINLDQTWSEYFLPFVRDHISVLSGVDGIFFDMVSPNISWLNNGDIDLNGDGVRDISSQADALWLNRTEYFFKRAKEIMPTMYIVDNGTSAAVVQPYVHGRMYENFPTPWEGDGSWGTVMNRVHETQKNNRVPHISIINSNTANTGVQNYRDVRFGLGSALLENGYFSYDYGDQNHGQTWWYDEYNVRLGQPIGGSVSRANYATYQPDLWHRDFDHGLVLVNSTPQLVAVDLGGDYEKINGRQDPTVNDGSIVSEVEIAPNDGLVLLKTTSRLDDVIFSNGSFARFYKPDGIRVRNGFFVFDEEYKGGAQILNFDFDGNAKHDTLVASGNKITATRDDGQPFFKIYPYTANYSGNLVLAVGDLDNDGFDELYVAPDKGSYPIKIYNLFGEEILPEGWYPFGKKYQDGYSLAIAGKGYDGRLVIGANHATGQNDHDSTVGLYDAGLKKTAEWSIFKQSNHELMVGAGDLDGDGMPEIVAGFGSGRKPTLKLYTLEGKEFGQPIIFAGEIFRNAQIQITDVNFDGAADIVLLTSGAL